MNITESIFVVTGTVILLISVKNFKFRYLLLSALSGIAALCATDIVMGFLGLNMPINMFTLLNAAIGGLPGVILINLLNAMF